MCGWTTPVFCTQRAKPDRRQPGDPFKGLGKIAALGIKVSRHCTYHGVALNVAMDLEPFSRINPCGYAGLQTVDLSTIGVSTTWDEAASVLGQQLSAPAACPLNVRAPHAMSTSEVVREAQSTENYNAWPSRRRRQAVAHPVKVEQGEVLKKPDWIRVKAGSPTTRFLRDQADPARDKLHTVCEEASCPNIGECFRQGHGHLHDHGRQVHAPLPVLRRGPWPPRPAGRERALNLARTIAASSSSSTW
jgi:hypothetical protein